MTTTMKRFVFPLFERHLIWLLLALLIAIGTTVPGFISVRNFTNVLWAAAPLGCMVLGLFFVLLTAELDLSLESTFAVAPTVAVVLVTQWAGELLWPGLVIPITLAMGALIGLFNGLFTVRLGVSAFLVTLAMLLALRGVVIFLIPEGIYYLPESVTYLGSGRIGGVVPVPVVVWLALYAAAWVLINRHRLGKDIYALGNNRNAAYIAGINIPRTKTLVFVIAGLVSAVGGILEVGRLQSVTADMGQGDILMVFAGAILGGTSLTGGVGRVGGIFAAVLVIAIIENLMNLYGIEPSVRQIAFGLILLAAIYLASLQGRMRLQAEAA
ncbi:ABC transporter permease [Arhodomonas sp. AD133]|uniref:ABC transporter permease n=1 Tax=Arhodomonas sp. AD133 TaxID=3415009 RepID=UPI003EBC4D6B